ncbi:hypothetical protein ACS0TY_035103 [Phlomoides rotata]
MEIVFLDTFGSYCDKSDTRFGQIAEIMGTLAQRVGSETCKKREEVYDHLGLIEFLTVGSRVNIAQYLCNHSKDMDLFFSLPGDANIVLVQRIMRKLDLGD